MSIFGIIGIGFLIAFALWVVSMGVTLFVECERNENYPVAQWVMSIIAIAIWIGAVFIGIGIYTEDERLFIAKFEAQKQTIEMSLDNENLSGLERIELVKQASELNGEMAERKAKLQVWHYITYNNSMYDNIEPISLETKGE
jgi:NADH:ubiquinone oxidoreductase subunit 5 (subunit L)/multisubunit Na+/H+ antiporter MnhA subunit